MRIFSVHLSPLAVAGFAMTLALAACSDKQTQPARDPVSANDPKPQRPFNDPKVQQPNDPIANDHHQPQRAVDDPVPQDPAFNPHSPRTALNDPEPQKPFYGPGTTSPENRVLAKTEKPLTDAEVVGVVNAANEGEVMMAELAIKKATNNDVKEFAGMMKTHHSAGIQKGKTLVQKTKITPADSDLSTYLKNDATAAMKDMRDKDGKAFDRAYMDTQVKAHKDVLQALDNRLTPSATNGEVKSMLAETRKVVSAHLTKAEDIQKRVDPSASIGGTHNSSMASGMGVPSGREPKQPTEKSTDKADKSGKAKVPEKTEPRP